MNLNGVFFLILGLSLDIVYFSEIVLKILFGNRIFRIDVVHGNIQIFSNIFR